MYIENNESDWIQDLNVCGFIFHHSSLNILLNLSVISFEDIYIDRPYLHTFFQDCAQKQFWKH